MKIALSFTGWIFGIFFFALWVVKNNDKQQADKTADTLRTTLIKKIPEITAQYKAVKDSVKKRDTRDSIKKAANPAKDTTSNVITKIDTVNMRLRSVLAITKKDYDAAILKKNLIIDSLSHKNIDMGETIGIMRKQARNIKFSNYNPAAVSPDTLNAAIYARPFKKSSHQSIFSPQLNYLRIYNQRPGGTVNDLPYFDYEQTNDEINELLFQARASENLKRGSALFGAGIELKLNRTGINTAVFFDPINHTAPTISLGLRQDVYRIKFK